MNTPPQPKIAPDPFLQQQEAQANRANIDALQTQAQGDTASLMARYGARLAISGAASGSPLIMSAVAGGMGKAA